MDPSTFGGILCRLGQPSLRLRGIADGFSACCEMYGNQRIPTVQSVQFTHLADRRTFAKQPKTQRLRPRRKEPGERIRRCRECLRRLRHTLRDGCLIPLRLQRSKALEVPGKGSDCVDRRAPLRCDPGLHHGRRRPRVRLLKAIEFDQCLDVPTFAVEVGSPSDRAGFEGIDSLAHPPFPHGDHAHREPCVRTGRRCPRCLFGSGCSVPVSLGEHQERPRGLESSTLLHRQACRSSEQRFDCVDMSLDSGAGPALRQHWHQCHIAQSRQAPGRFHRSITAFSQRDDARLQRGEPRHGSRIIQGLPCSRCDGRIPSFQRQFRFDATPDQGRRGCLGQRSRGARAVSLCPPQGSFRKSQFRSRCPPFCPGDRRRRTGLRAVFTNHAATSVTPSFVPTVKLFSHGDALSLYQPSFIASLLTRGSLKKDDGWYTWALSTSSVQACLRWLDVQQKFINKLMMLVNIVKRTPRKKLFVEYTYIASKSGLLADMLLLFFPPAYKMAFRAAFTSLYIVIDQCMQRRHRLKQQAKKRLGSPK